MMELFLFLPMGHNLFFHFYWRRRQKGTEMNQWNVFAVTCLAVGNDLRHSSRDSLSSQIYRSVSVTGAQSKIYLMHGLISYLSFTRLLVSLSEYKKKKEVELWFQGLRFWGLRWGEVLASPFEAGLVAFFFTRWTTGARYKENNLK